MLVKKLVCCKFITIMATASAIFSSKMEIRAVIRFLWLNSYEPAQIYREVFHAAKELFLDRLSRSGLICLKIYSYRYH